MQSGEQLITLVPTDAPLEVEMRIATADAGYGTPIEIATANPASIGKVALVRLG